MTKYNTGNPIGSTAVKDLYDNAENLDVLTNDKTKEAHPDRLGVPRKTWHGMEQDFQRFLLNSGYQDLGDYAAGLEITARNQVFRKDGEMYRAGAALDLPYTTTGDWATEGSLFVAVGDALLREKLKKVSYEVSDEQLTEYIRNKNLTFGGSLIELTSNLNMPNVEKIVGFNAEYVGSATTGVLRFNNPSYRTSNILNIDGKVITLDGVTGVKVGDLLKMYESSPTGDASVGEMGVITEINGNSLTVRDELLFDAQYEIAEFFVAKELIIDDCTLVNKSNSETRGCLISGYSSVTISNSRIDDFKVMGIVVSDCLNVSIENNRISIDPIEGLRCYGINISDACRNVSIIGNVMSGGNHNISTTTYNGKGYVGHCLVSNNTLTDSLEAAFATHRANGSLLIVNNTVDNCKHGFDVRDGVCVMRGNFIKNINNAALIYRNAVPDCVFESNVITDSRFGIRTLSSVSSTENFKIANNTFNNVTHGTIDLSGYGSIDGLIVQNNTSSTCGAYFLTSASITNNLLFKGNTIDNVTYGIILTNSDEAFVQNNIFRGVIPVRVEGGEANRLQVVENTWTRPVSFISSTGTLTGLLRKSNVRSGSQSLTVDGGTIRISGDGAYVIYHTKNVDIVNISGGTIGDVIHLYTTSSSYSFTLTEGGNVRGGATVGINEAVSYLFTGSVWVKLK